MKFDDSTEAGHQTSINNLIKQTEKLTILNETDEEEQLEDVIINVLGDRSAEKSNVTPADSSNFQTETEPRRAVGSE
ncbi:hypothetical protein, partial [Serratia marcescens]|uniref:hypothetical protein n=1 Tax=Serratia marcescens TaxID=615 RepID=UPI002812CC1D